MNCSICDDDPNIPTFTETSNLGCIQYQMFTQRIKTCGVVSIGVTPYVAEQVVLLAGPHDVIIHGLYGDDFMPWNSELIFLHLNGRVKIYSKVADVPIHEITEVLCIKPAYIREREFVYTATYADGTSAVIAVHKVHNNIAKWGGETMRNMLKHCRDNRARAKMPTTSPPLLDPSLKGEAS